MKIYTAASFKHLHAVRLFQQTLERDLFGVDILDWTKLAAPPLELTPAQRRDWMDTDLSGEVFHFCEGACGSADLMVYLGHSGQDAGVEVGLARAAGVPILGILGPLEAPGLMLHGAVSLWVRDIADACEHIAKLSRCLGRDDPPASCCTACPSEKICTMAPATLSLEA